MGGWRREGAAFGATAGKGRGLCVTAGKASGFGWLCGSLGLMGDFVMARARLNIAGFFTLLNRFVSGGGVSQNTPKSVNTLRVKTV